MVRAIQTGRDVVNTAHQWQCSQDVPVPVNMTVHVVPNIQRMLPHRIRPLLQPVNDYSMAVRARNDRVSGQIRWRKGWEKCLTAVFGDEIHRLRDAQGTVTFLDIGTNIGWFSVLAAALGAQVISIEPNAENVYLIERSLCLNKFQSRVRLHQVGAGATNEQCAIISPAVNVGDTQLACGDVSAAVAHWNAWKGGVWAPYVVRGVVNVRRVDDVVGDVRVDIMKVDIEGFEGGALPGWHTIFSSPGSRRMPTLVLTEFQPSVMRDNGYDPEAYFQFFIRKGYGVTAVDKLPWSSITGMEPIDLEAHSWHGRNASNFFLDKSRARMSSDLIFHRKRKGWPFPHAHS